jgi:hypothetical protein
MSRIPRIRRRARSHAGLAGVPRAVGGAVPAALATPGGGASMTAGTRSGHGWLSFRRIVDIPFETCVAALENWPPAGPDGELHPGHSLVRGPAEHKRDTGTCRVEIRLARGRLRPPLRMRLDIDRWTWSPARTALELIPGQRVRPTAAYFRAGHLLLDSLIRALPQHNAQAHAADPGPPSSLGPPRTRSVPGPACRGDLVISTDEGDFQSIAAATSHRPEIGRP